jgi:hypothetical protein
MTEFVRPIQERIEDILVLDIEALCDFADNLQYHIPDSLSERAITEGRFFCYRAVITKEPHSMLNSKH